MRVSKQGAQRLRSGHVWVYRDDARDPGGLQPGQLVRVDDPQGNFIGQAFWAQKSKLALRLLSRSDETIDAAWFRRRLERALQRRRQLEPTADAFRWVHGESDELPGLLVDKYGDALTMQTLSEGADARKLEWAPVLAELAGAKKVVLRDDGSSRDFEGLPRESRILIGSDANARYHEGDNLFEADLMADHKTGAFLDQRGEDALRQPVLQLGVDRVGEVLLHRVHKGVHHAVGGLESHVFH